MDEDRELTKKEVIVCLVFLIVISVLAVSMTIMHYINQPFPPQYEHEEVFHKEKSKNNCPLIGGTACIVEEWQPICLFRDCIIDTRGEEE